MQDVTQATTKDEALQGVVNLLYNVLDVCEDLSPEHGLISKHLRETLDSAIVRWIKEGPDGGTDDG